MEKQKEVEVCGVAKGKVDDRDDRLSATSPPPSGGGGGGWHPVLFNQSFCSPVPFHPSRPDPNLAITSRHVSNLCAWPTVCANAGGAGPEGGGGASGAAKCCQAFVQTAQVTVIYHAGCMKGKWWASGNSLAPQCADDRVLPSTLHCRLTRTTY
jgi:hypothetical protein